MYCIGVLLSLTGCYTQMSLDEYEMEPVREKGKPRSDTLYVVIDTVIEEEDTTFDTTWFRQKKQIPQTRSEKRTTVIVREREYCFWKRDFWGRPELRCFDSYSDFEWHLYVNTPWWYRSRLSLYDRYGCPPGYYYDPYTGVCRYYRDYHRYYSPERYYRERPSDERRPAPRPRSRDRDEQQQRRPARRPRSYGIEEPREEPRQKETQKKKREKVPEEEEKESEQEKEDETGHPPRRRRFPRR
jgi:hypothetical protein